MKNQETGENRDHIVTVLLQLDFPDPKFAEAIAWQEERTFNPASIRYEPEFFDRYMKSMSVQDLKARNPHCPVRCSYETERTLEACSFGPMHLLGATARECGFRGAFLTELVRSTHEALLWSKEYLARLLKTAKVKGYRDRELCERLALAWNCGPVAFSWDHIPGERLNGYVAPVLREYERIGGSFTLLNESRTV